MNYETVKPGKYPAKIVGWGVVETKPGEMPKISIKFKFEVDGYSRVLTWSGNLKTEKAREFTLKNLFRCGFNGDDLSVLANPENKTALDMTKELEIEVENRTTETGSNAGKTFANIKWINEPAGAKFKGLLNEQMASSSLSALQGDVAAMKHKLGIQDKPAQKLTDDLPF